MMKFIDSNEEEFFEERAAIAQYDAGMSLEHAEYFAWQQVLKRRELLEDEYL